MCRRDRMKMSGSERRECLREDRENVWEEMREREREREKEREHQRDRVALSTFVSLDPSCPLRQTLERRGKILGSRR
jgi:hypothetical protein